MTLAETFQSKLTADFTNEYEYFGDGSRSGRPPCLPMFVLRRSSQARSPVATHLGEEPGLLDRHELEGKVED